MKYLAATHKNISEIHPKAPVFTYVNKISGQGMRRHIRFLTYEPSLNDFVDITEIVAQAISGKYSTAGILFSGTGIDAQSELFNRLNSQYETLKGKKLEKKLEKFSLSDKPFIEQYANDFLKKKENKLKFASAEQQADCKFVYECVKTCGTCVQYANTKLLDNKKIALAAIVEDAEALRHLGHKIKNSEEYVRLAVETKPKAYQWASERICSIIENQCPENPKSYLDSYLLKQKLDAQVEQKNNQIKKIKI